ncbi:MAG: cupredoxin domain-containing protein [Candidatus Nanoarchaeia archaeon]|nr:cupredoxin domain-containing protein [Candidatus Nanoarchaeia archaeon]
MIKRGIFLILLLIFVSGCYQTNTNTPVTSTINPNEIIIKDFSFNPSTLTINAGTEVTWTNQDSVVHKIIIKDLTEGNNLNQGDKFTFTFANKGTYDYSCAIHPSMTGKIIVN